MPERLFIGLDERHPRGALDRILAFDWEQSSAGAIEAWPEDLKSAVRLMLLSQTAMAVLVGRDGLLIYNDALLKTFGEQHAGMLGKPVTSVLPAAAGFLRDAITACYEGKGLRLLDNPIKLQRNGASERAWFSLSFTPVADKYGKIYGAFVVVSETSERMRVLNALEQSRRRMELALDAGGIVGTWDLDVRTSRVTANGAFAGMLGLPGHEVGHGVSTDILSTSVHHLDRERVLAELKAAIESGSDYRCRYRAVTGDGAIRWFVVSGRPITDQRGRVVQVAGIVIDVTEQTETAAALEQSNLRYDILTESIPQIVWSTDAEGRHDYFNRRWNEFTGIPPEQIEPTTWQTLVHPDDWPRVSKTWRDCLATGRPYDIDYRFRYRNGDYRWLKVVALPIRDSDGRIARWYGTSTDIDAERQIQEQRELVAHELDHRIKNLFTLVNGLVSLSLREQPELAPLAATLRSRLDALNRAHGLIWQKNSEACSLRALLEQLLEPYASGRHIVLDGPDAAIDPGLVTSIALVLHELITNAVKHGALSHVDGTLHVAFKVEGDRQVIDWHEHFDGGASAGAGEGFGSRLLKATVEGQLRGRITRTLSPQGMQARIDLPRFAPSAPSSSASR